MYLCCVHTIDDSHQHNAHESVFTIPQHMCLDNIFRTKVVNYLLCAKKHSCHLIKFDYLMLYLMTWIT